MNFRILLFIESSFSLVSFSGIRFTDENFEHLAKKVYAFEIPASLHVIVHIVREIGAFHGKEIRRIEAIVAFQDFADDVFIQKRLVLVQKILESRIENLEIEVLL